MDKQYKKISFYGGQSIENAVRKLLEYKAKGILACGEFNDTILYSDTVTLENAYISITGRTKAECERKHQEWLDNYNKQEEEHKAQIPALTEKWREKGKSILTEEKWEFWDEIVPIRLGDLYHGMELGCCLEIVQLLNNGGSLEDAKEMIGNQSHSGMSYGLVCTMVKEFCERGEEFVKYVK